jgi:hypothetical protein
LQNEVQSSFPGYNAGLLSSWAGGWGKTNRTKLMQGFIFLWGDKTEAVQSQCWILEGFATGKGVMDVKLRYMEQVLSYSARRKRDPE